MAIDEYVATAPATRTELLQNRFTEIFSGYSNDVYRHLLNMTCNPDAAMDLSQETYEKAWKAYRKRNYREDNPKAWILRIATNTFINYHRKQKRSAIEISVDDPHQMMDTTLDTGTGYTDATAWSYDPQSVLGLPGLNEDVDPRGGRALEQLANLPEQFKAAVTLRDLEELSYKEIAAVLGIPLGTVRSQIFRGRRLLRDKVRESFSDN